LPDAGETVTQLAGLLAVHAQPPATESAMDPDAPDAGAFTLLADSDGAQAMPACETGIAVPAIVIVVLRDADAEFAATEYDALPEPDPDGVTVTQLTGLLAVQVQPAAAVTGTEPAAPEAGAFTDVEAAAGAQAMPACETAIATPATVSVVLREAVDVFALIVYAALPDPEPDGVTVAQFTGLLAVHVQPVPAVTGTEPDAPETAAVMSIAGAVGAHGCAL
jgi:hypothetical protein